MVIPTSIAMYNGVFSPIPRTLPSFKDFVSGIAVSFLVFDGLYFFWHWAHHKVPFLYRKFHAVHHEVRAYLLRSKADQHANADPSVQCTLLIRGSILEFWRNAYERHIRSSRTVDYGPYAPAYNVDLHDYSHLSKC